LVHSMSPSRKSLPLRRRRRSSLAKCARKSNALASPLRMSGLLETFITR
jgi:hypothetical protein